MLRQLFGVDESNFAPVSLPASPSISSPPSGPSTPLLLEPSVRLAFRPGSPTKPKRRRKPKIPFSPTVPEPSRTKRLSRKTAKAKKQTSRRFDSDGDEVLDEAKQEKSYRRSSGKTINARHDTDGDATLNDAKPEKMVRRGSNMSAGVTKNRTGGHIRTDDVRSAPKHRDNSPDPVSHAPRVSDSTGDASNALDRKRGRRSLIDTKPVPKRRRSLESLPSPVASTTPPRQLSVEKSVPVAHSKLKRPSYDQRSKMAETALAAFALSDTALPSDGKLSSIEGCDIDPTPIVDWLSLLFLCHARIAKVQLSDSRNLVEEKNTTSPRWHWSKVLLNHNIRVLPFVESANDVANLLVKVGHALLMEHNAGKGQLIDSWYNSTTVSQNALTFVFMVLELWRHYADMDCLDDSHAPQGDTVEKLILGVTHILSVELDSVGGHWFVFEARHMERTLVWNLSKPDEGGIGKLFEQYCAYIESSPHKPTQMKRTKSAITLFDLHITLLPQSSGTALPHLRGLWNVYRPFVSCSFAKYFESDFFWSSLAPLVSLKYNHRASSTSSATSRYAPMVLMLLKDNVVSEEVLSPLKKVLKMCEDQKTDQQKKCTAYIFAGLVKQLQKVAASTLSRSSAADFAADVEIVKIILSSVDIQSRILGYHDPAVKDKFLGAVEDLIVHVAELCPALPESDYLKLAEKWGLGYKGGRVMNPVDVKTDRADNLEPNLEMAIGLVISILSSFVKSFSSGDRKLLGNTSLRALLNSRPRTKRSLGHLFTAVIRIQWSAEPIVDGLEICSLEDRDGFATAVELIRLELLASSEENRKSEKTVTVRRIAEELSGADLEESIASVASQDAEEKKIVFPSVVSSKEISSVVASTEHRNFDDDQHNLRMISSRLKRAAEVDLARYDPNFEKPSRYVRLTRNVYVGDARSQLAREHRTYPGRCKCVPGIVSAGNSDNGICCSNGSCENVATKYECDPRKCPVGQGCRNQQMQRDTGPAFKEVHLGEKGIGLVADEDIEAHRYIGEYRGEVVTAEEFKRREELYVGERHFYAMTLTPKLTIDASRKSAITRFINHSCDPNAEAQKWIAGGEPRIALFATRRIGKGEEVTFNYAALSGGLKAKACLCGTAKCKKTLTQSRGDAGLGVVDTSSATNEKIKKAKRKLEQVSKLRARARNVDICDKAESAEPRFLRWKTKYENNVPRFTKKGSAFRIPRISVEAAKAKEATMAPVRPVAAPSQPVPRYTRLVVNSRGPNRFGPGPITKEQAAALNKSKPLPEDLDWGSNHPLVQRNTANQAEKQKGTKDENALPAWKPKKAPGKPVFQITERDVASGRVVLPDMPKKREAYDSDYSDVSETIPVFDDYEPMDTSAAEPGASGPGTDDEFEEAPPIEEVVASGFSGPASPAFDDVPHDSHHPAPRPHPPPAPVHPGRRYDDASLHHAGNMHQRPDPYHQAPYELPGRTSAYGQHERQKTYINGPERHTRHQWEGGAHSQRPSHRQGRGAGVHPRDGRAWGRDSYDQRQGYGEARINGFGAREGHHRERDVYHQQQPLRRHRRESASAQHWERGQHQEHPPPHHLGASGSGDHDKWREQYHEAQPSHPGRGNGPASRDSYHTGGGQDHHQDVRHSYGHRESRRSSHPSRGRHKQELNSHFYSRGAPGHLPPHQPMRRSGSSRDFHSFGAPTSASVSLAQRNSRPSRDSSNRGSPGPSLVPAPGRNRGHSRDVQNLPVRKPLPSDAQSRDSEAKRSSPISLSKRSPKHSEARTQGASVSTTPKDTARPGIYEQSPLTNQAAGKERRSDPGTVKGPIQEPGPGSPQETNPKIEPLPSSSKSSRNPVVRKERNSPSGSEQEVRPPKMSSENLFALKDRESVPETLTATIRHSTSKASSPSKTLSKNSAVPKERESEPEGVNESKHRSGSKMSSPLKNLHVESSAVKEGELATVDGKNPSRFGGHGVPSMNPAGTRSTREPNRELPRERRKQRPHERVGRSNKRSAGSSQEAHAKKPRADIPPVVSDLRDLLGKGKRK